jgi:hypothetical protein
MLPQLSEFVNVSFATPPAANHSTHLVQAAHRAWAGDAPEWSYWSNGAALDAQVDHIMVAYLKHFKSPF